MDAYNLLSACFAVVYVKGLFLRWNSNVFQHTCTEQHGAVQFLSEWMWRVRCNAKFIEKRCAQNINIRGPLLTFVVVVQVSGC